MDPAKRDNFICDTIFSRGKMARYTPPSEIADGMRAAFAELTEFIRLHPECDAPSVKIGRTGLTLQMWRNPSWTPGGPPQITYTVHYEITPPTHLD